MCELEDSITSLGFCLQALMHQKGMVKEAQIDENGELVVELKALKVLSRGAESDHVQVLVDGVQVNQPGGAFDFASLTVDEVERIEVVRGPGSALYGSDAVAGVIQIVTRRGGSSPSGSATVRAGSFGRLDGSVSVTGGGATASYGLTLSRLTTDGILEFNNRHEQTVLSGQARIRGAP